MGRALIDFSGMTDWAFQSPRDKPIHNNASPLEEILGQRKRIDDLNTKSRSWSGYWPLSSYPALKQSGGHLGITRVFVSYKSTTTTYA